VGRHSDNFDLVGLRLGTKEFDLFCIAYTWIEVYVAVSPEKSWQFIIAGVVMLASAVCCCSR
jgi:hypothetical protein